jgi:hypothetical protein
MRRKKDFIEKALWDVVLVLVDLFLDLEAKKARKPKKPKKPK